MPKTLRYLQRNLSLLSILRQIPSAQVFGKAKTQFRRRVQQSLQPVTRSAFARRRLRFLDDRFGFEHGNRHFWKSRLGRSWSQTESRLFRLAETGQPELIRSFVRDALLHSVGAPIVMMLARSEITKDVLADQLRDPAMVARIAARIHQQHNFASGVVAAAAFLLEDEELAHLTSRFEAAGLQPTSQHGLFLDSFATVPGSRPALLTGTVGKAPSRRPARHRLIIADALRDPTRLSILFTGAEKVSLFSPANLYGRMTFSDSTRVHALPKELLITHPRSRATRFSTVYHDLHEETRHLAEEIVAELAQESGDWLNESGPYLALHIADALFFQSLPILGIQELLADDDIDQIMIVCGDQSETAFFEFISQIKGLGDDPRVEFLSLGTSEAVRTRFSRNLDLAFDPARPGPRTVPARVRSLPVLLERMRSQAGKSAAAMRPWPAGQQDRSRILFFTIPFPTYNASTMAYADILFRNFDTMVGIVGRNAGNLFKSAPDLPIPPASRVQMLPTLANPAFPSLNDAIRQVLERVADRHLQTGDDRITPRLVQRKGAALSSQTIASGLYHWEQLLQWFGRMQAAGQMPDVLVVSPLRPALVGMAAAAARRFGVPSLAVEPHIINAEYCRYTRVMTDRYGTVSRYLADLAENGFSVPADRIDIIGSPRLIATPPATPDAARQTLEKDGLARFPAGHLTLAFFSQPSRWDQISEVWRIILAAMAPHPDLQILLKVHPEEGDLRIASYLAIAESMGLGDRVQSVSAPPGTVIEAADLILSCYSTTLVEAALAGRPVFSVANSGMRYPIDQHEVVGAPQFCDVASLSDAFAQFRRDPAASASQVARFMEQNPQFVTGPEPNLVAAINAMAAADPACLLRPAADLPPRLFIEGPYRVYDI